jgi:hypothetical protein
VGVVVRIQSIVCAYWELSCGTRWLSHPESPWTHRRDASRVRVCTVARVSVW